MFLETDLSFCFTLVQFISTSAYTILGLTPNIQPSFDWCIHWNVSTTFGLMLDVYSDIDNKGKEYQRFQVVYHLEMTLLDR